MSLFLRILGPLCLFITLSAWADLRDPTRPLISAAAVTNGPQLEAGELQAILISRGRRLAIFNGRTLLVGSDLAGMKVVAIEANAVHLAGPNGKMTLFLFNQSIKQRVKPAT